MPKIAAKRKGKSPHSPTYIITAPLGLILNTENSRAVLTAYGWKTDLPGEEILEKLLALNFESVKTLSETNRNRRMKSTTNIEVTEEIKQKVITFVKQNGFITNRQCRVLLGIGYEQAIALLNKLVESGELIREGKTSSVKYRLSIK
jgi:Fic family protein